MTTSPQDKIVGTYLDELNDELRALSPDRRAEILEGVEEHIRASDAATETEFREVLQRLGTPQQIAAEALDAPPLQPPVRRLRKKLILVTLALVVTLSAIVVGVTTLVFSPLRVPSTGMEPTLGVGDVVLTNKLGDFARGDVVTLTAGGSVGGGHSVTKRIVALGGDTIEARDGRVFLNDQVLTEGYLSPGTVTNGIPRQLVPVGHVWVLGDNRESSADSRVFGPIATRDVRSSVILRIWPLSRIGSV